MATMRSVADDLRRELKDRVQDLSAEERLALAFQLGEAGLASFERARGLDRQTALKLLQRRRQRQRRTPSRAMEEIIG